MAKQDSSYASVTVTRIIRSSKKHPCQSTSPWSLTLRGRIMVVLKDRHQVPSFRAMSTEPSLAQKSIAYILFFHFDSNFLWSSSHKTQEQLEHNISSFGTSWMQQPNGLVVLQLSAYLQKPSYRFKSRYRYFTKFSFFRELVGSSKVPILLFFLLFISLFAFIFLAWFLASFLFFLKT